MPELKAWSNYRLIQINDEIGHNHDVNSFFAALPTSINRTALKTLCLLTTTDSYTTYQVKRDFFLYNVLRIQHRSTDAIASVPEWWQLRVESQRPQLIVIFAEFSDSLPYKKSRWSISIPHPIITQFTSSPLPNYRKGNIEGILTLKDNSKVIVNGYDLSEVNKIINAAKLIIDPSYIVNSPLKIGNRSGPSLLTINVMPVRADYYANGLASTTPDHISKFV